MEKNPYAPTTAEIVDVVLALRKARPRNVNIALVLIGGNVALQFLLHLRGLINVHFHIDNPAVLGFAVAEYLLMAVLIHQLAQGRGWPRLVLLILTVAVFAVNCYAIGTVVRIMPDEIGMLYSPEFLLHRVVPLVANFTALHLLFFSSGTWFDESR